MFYPLESLKKGGRFYLCWMADAWPLRFATVTHRQLRSQDIRAISDHLLEVVNNESGRVTKRFSLRLSSQLLHGLIRIYQKKVDIFICDVCMLNAVVIEICQRKFAEDNVGPVAVRRPPIREIPRIQIEEIPDEEVERQLLNSKVVARVGDITLRETTLPGQLLPVEDGFGELHPDQALLAVLDKSMEVMLAQETSAIQYSALDLPDISTERSHDKSRLAPHDPAQMERISEQDISVFRKSAEVSAQVHFEKEIPEISVIPPSDLTAPQPDNQVAEISTVAREDGVCNDRPAIEKTLNGVQDIVLEKLEDEPQAKRRKLKNKLIVDNRIQLETAYLKARIGNNDLELRCENKRDNKAADLRTPSHVLLSRPVHCGPSTLTRFGISLGNMFTRARAELESIKIPAKDVEFQYPLLPRKSHLPIRETIAQSITSHDKTIQDQEVQERSLKDVTRIFSTSGLQAMEETPVVPPVEAMDISELPTQKIPELPTQKIPEASPSQKRASNYEEPAKKRRPDKVFRLRSPPEVTAREMNKENLRTEENILHTEQVTDETSLRRLTSLLQTSGLANINDKPDVEPTTIARRKPRLTNSDTSETPLGSLDRTKVSLGESEVSTDSQKFIRDEWGTEGTMFKIFNCIHAGVAPITVARLLRRGPLVPGRERLIASRCFMSILKLKQHGFINIIKKDDSNDIKDITLGRLFI